jgi:hypothetical protein
MADDSWFVAVESHDSLTRDVSVLDTSAHMPDLMHTHDASAWGPAAHMYDVCWRGEGEHVSLQPV